MSKSKRIRNFKQLASKYYYCEIDDPNTGKELGDLLSNY
jgi:hypothetical protein